MSALGNVAALALEQIVNVPSLKISRRMIVHGLPQEDRTTFGATEFGTMQREMVRKVCTTLGSDIFAERKALGPEGRIFT